MGKPVFYGTSHNKNLLDAARAVREHAVLPVSHGYNPEVDQGDVVIPWTAWRRLYKALKPFEGR